MAAARSVFWNRIVFPPAGFAYPEVSVDGNGNNYGTSNKRHLVSYGTLLGTWLVLLRRSASGGLWLGSIFTCVISPRHGELLRYAPLTHPSALAAADGEVLAGIGDALADRGIGWLWHSAMEACANAGCS
jgi:hypothetical protein